MSAGRAAGCARWILGAAALAASGGLAAAPTDILDDCASGPAPHVGIKEFSSACPQVEPTIVSLGLDALLYEGWRDKLTSSGLKDLSQLVQRYSESRRQAAPDTRSLQPILQSLRLQSEDRESWWDAAKKKFRAWLKHSDSALAKWLNAWLERIDVSEQTLDRGLYLLAALIVIAAVIVVVREMRISAKGRRQAGNSELADVETMRGAPPADPRRLAGIRGLLQALIDRLQSTGRLASAGSLTHRELVLRSAFDTERQREIFAVVAHDAESLLFGPRSRGPEISPDLAEHGRDLLAQLSDRRQPS